MIDPDLERRLSDCRTLLKLWSRFQEFFDMSVRNDGINPDNEKKFLELKSRVAMLHDSFMDSIEEKSAPVAQGMLDNVIRAITLKHVSLLNAADVKKMQIEWHESYLLMNECIGMLEEEQATKAKISRSAWQLQQWTKGASRGGGNIFHNIYLRMAVVIGVIIFLLVGLPLMGVFKYWAVLDFAPTQPAAYFVLNKFIRPYVEVPWRNVDEAKNWGRLNQPYPYFPDYVLVGLVPGALSTNSKINSWADQKAKMKLNNYSGLDSLRSAGYSFEAWGFSGKHMLVMHFLMKSNEEAQQTVATYKNWVGGLPPGAKAGFGSITVGTNNNMVLLIECGDSGARTAFCKDIWGIM